MIYSISFSKRSTFKHKTMAGRQLDEPFDKWHLHFDCGDCGKEFVIWDADRVGDDFKCKSCGYEMKMPDARCDCNAKKYMMIDMGYDV